MTAIFLAVVAAVPPLFGLTANGILTMIGAGVFYFICVLLTGTKPGGPGVM